MCQCVPRFQSDPVVARDVRSRDDVGPFSQFGKFFGSGLEGNPDRSRFERDNGEHLAANLEQKVVAPLDLLRSMRQGDAEFAYGIDGHERVVFNLGRRQWERVGFYVQKYSLPNWSREHLLWTSTCHPEAHLLREGSPENVADIDALTRLLGPCFSFPVKEPRRRQSKFEASREILRAKDALQDDSTYTTVNSPTGHQANGTGLPNVEVIRPAGVR